MTQVKPQARLIGFDDGPFTFEDETTPLVGVMTRGPGYVESVLIGQVSVDGRDATQAILGLLEGQGLLETVQAILLDGGTMAGFNPIDLAALHQATKVPVAALTKDRPDPEAVETAVRKRFQDADERLELLTGQPVEPLATPGEHAPLHVRRVGADLDTLQALVSAHTVQGRLPEPLRIAHLVATAVKEGASRGA